MTTIAVDAMGGDNAPRVEVEGALAAAHEYGTKIILVGREEEVRKELDKHSGWKSLPIEIHHASEVITMEDSAAKAFRSKKDSSIRVASRLVHAGSADGVVSAGNTGAVMATVKIVQGIVHGVERPTLATTLPTKTGNPTVLLDVGANVDSTPKMLAQFAVMGEIFARNILHVDNPRVALLSIGEEEHKGNELTKAATPLLKALPLNFVGNCEGRDLFKGNVDVVVCDGFTGNVALKVSEGVADVIKVLLRESLTSSMMGKAGAFLAKGAFQKFRRRVDYSEWGGAPLLGVRGVCIICHGSSNANAIKNAIRVAGEFAEEKLNAKIENELLRWTAPEVATPGD